MGQIHSEFLIRVAYNDENEYDAKCHVSNSSLILIVQYIHNM